MPSKRIKRNLLAIQALARANQSLQKSMISNANKDFIESLVECAMNIIRGNVPLSSPEFRRLKRYHSLLKDLTKKRVSLKKRRNILQKGGFIGAFLKPLMSLLLN